VPSEDLLAAVWPVAVRLVRLERRAKRDKKGAARYRRACREAAELMRTWPESPVPLPALQRTAALDPSCWRTVLAPRGPYGSTGGGMSGRQRPKQAARHQTGDQFRNGAASRLLSPAQCHDIFVM
jgi:hypothetical protein